MSFSFEFTKDDFSDDELVESPIATNVQTREFINPLDQLSSSLDETSLPKLHPLDSILTSLLDVRLTFDSYTTPIGSNLIYRRELFDVKHQIMCEDNQSNSLTNEILIGENEEVDLKKNYYEGGFKSWECTYDTIDKLSNLSKQNKLSKFSSFLELGCGTSLPTGYILMNKFKDKDNSPTTFILSDFNYDVLRLVTVPNLIINWASTLQAERLHALMTNEDGPVLNNDELLLTSKLVEQFKSDLNSLNIKLKFISGSWSRQFNQLLDNKSIDFIISSETIYSLDTLPIIAESILEITNQSKSNHSQILLVAKNMYFGVGGSIIEFMNYINKRKTEEYNLQVEEINDSQLKRSIVNIEYHRARQVR